MQLDMGNALYGGADLVGILERYPDRAGTVHLKPYTQSEGEADGHDRFPSRYWRRQRAVG